jgi:putative tryptophan/tyrosine transport system substrate-binding protein
MQFDPLKRRDFITLLGGAAVAWPLAARAQQPERMRRIGVLMVRAEGDREGQNYAAAFRRGLTALGWVAGQNVEVEYRWQASNASMAQAFAKELVEFRPDILVVNATPSLAAMRQATRTIPIVFVGVADPVGQGFVPSLAQPGGNITGFGLEEPSMGAKWVELLKEIAPRVARAVILFNPETAPFARMFLASMEAAAGSAALTLTVAPVSDDAEAEQAIVAAGREESGLIALPDSFLFGRREMIVALTASQHTPAVYAYRAFVTDGGLIAYGIDRIDLFRRAAGYVDRILKGAKPAELPVQLPTKFELAVNLNTAKSLGLEVPPTLLARADEVIE